MPWTRVAIVTCLYFGRGVCCRPDGSENVPTLSDDSTIKRGVDTERFPAPAHDALAAQGSCAWTTLHLQQDLRYQSMWQGAPPNCPGIGGARERPILLKQAGKKPHHPHWSLPPQTAGPPFEDRPCQDVAESFSPTLQRPDWDSPGSSQPSSAAHRASKLTAVGSFISRVKVVSG